MLRNRRSDRVQVKNLTPVVGTITEYGDEDETALDYYDTGSVIAALIAPLSSAEDETDRETVQTQYDVYFDPDVEVYATSHVILYADTDDPLEARVMGQPLRMRTAMRGLTHVVARVEVISG